MTVANGQSRPRRPPNVDGPRGGLRGGCNIISGGWCADEEMGACSTPLHVPATCCGVERHVLFVAPLSVRDAGYVQIDREHSGCGEYRRLPDRLVALRGSGLRIDIVCSLVQPYKT